MKGNKKIGAMLILAAFLMGAGCKPQQSPEPGVKPTPAPQQPEPPKQDTPAVIAEALQFSGKFEDNQSENGKIKPYDITITIGNGRVGATVEGRNDGFLYVGSNVYDAENKTVDVTVVNIQNQNDSFSVAGVYQAQNKVFILTEFKDWTGKAIVPMVTRKDVKKAKSYTLPVTLPHIGQSLLVIQVNDSYKATVVIAAGAPSGGKDTGAMRTYKAQGYVRRDNRLFVRVPLDNEDINKAREVLEIEATLLPTGRVRDLNAQFLEHHDTGEEADYGRHDGLTDTRLPRFKKAKLAFKDSTGKKCVLELKAEPVVRRPSGSNAYYETYAMTAQFFRYEDNGVELSRSKEVMVDGVLTPGTSIKYIEDAAKKIKALDKKNSNPSYTFDFKAGLFVSNNGKYGLCNEQNAATDAARVVISDWKPLNQHEYEQDIKVSSGYTIYPNPVRIRSNVETGEYKVSLEGKLNGASAFSACKDKDGTVWPSITSVDAKTLFPVTYASFERW